MALTIDTSGRIRQPTAGSRRPRLPQCETIRADRQPPPEMPRRQDLKSILILGSGPIVIGQARESDYSGVQACKALRGDGYKISEPARRAHRVGRWSPSAPMR